jgi:hypothetical protein
VENQSGMNFVPIDAHRPESLPQMRFNRFGHFASGSSCPAKSAKRVFALDVPGIHALAML